MKRYIVLTPVQEEIIDSFVDNSIVMSRIEFINKAINLQIDRDLKLLKAIKKFK